MKKNNLIWIIICNILGALLLGSWLASTPTAGYHGPWLALDQSVFYFFNQKLAQGTAFTYFIAFVNLRAFDVVAFVAMLAIFYSYYRKSNVEGIMIVSSSQSAMESFIGTLMMWEVIMPLII